MAEYFVQLYMDQLPVERRATVKDLYYSWVNVVHSEVAMRLGNVKLAQSKIGSLIELYPRLSPTCQSLLNSSYEVSQTCTAEI